MAEAAVNPIVDIISRLWTCCARHTRYLCKLQQNMDLLRNAMNELKNVRNDVQRKVVEAEADLNEPKMRTDSVSGWLQSVEKNEGEVEVILQKANEQLSRARCLGGCCPPNNCWSNYKLGKSISKKIPSVNELKVNGKFEEVTYVVRHTNYRCKLQDNKFLLGNAMEELKNVRNDVQRKVVEAEANQSEPKMRTDQVRGWLQSVEIIEGEVEVILQTSDEQLSNAECHEKDKLVVMKMASVGEFKRNGHFEEVTYVVWQTTYRRKMQHNKIILWESMEQLKDMRNDVQRKVVDEEADQSEPKMRTDQVRGWLQSVNIIEGEVEVILLKSDEQLSDAECHEKDKIVVMKTASVDEFRRNGHFEKVTYPLLPPHVQDMNLESTVGMESMFDKVWRLINSTIDEPVANSIGLYGQGGVGKTTLLEKINNEFHNKISTGEQHGFDYVVIFVVVSKPINYEDIQKKIGERLGLSLQGDEKSRAEKIFNALRNKNHVLLLDDIWEKVDKKRIGIPIHPSQGNSKLIFTTRSQRVCGLMEATHTFQVECLSWDKAWRLFQDKVGEDALTSFPGARELAKDVAKECGGLPLALITIGRAMSTKKSVQEWRDAIKTLRRYASEFEGMSDEVLPRLKLSYDYLHNDTEKSCFRYCSLYPEDYSIEIAKLVDLWIAEGFLDGIDQLDEARDRGHTIIESLKSACLLKSSREDYVKMHDVIRDLAFWIVNDCRSSDVRGSNSDNKFLVAVNDPCKKWENAERIFWYNDGTTSSDEEEDPPTSPNLLTLIVRKMKVQNHSFDFPRSFFQHMPLLRVVDLSNTRFLYNEFPISICELHELQYLNLSKTEIKELPVELRKLVKLKFLLLRNTYWLRRIPAGLIANLSELQVLDLGCNDNPNNLGVEDWELEDGPSFSELDGLKQLQEVRITITTYVAFEKFLCNRKLQMVCTGLKLLNYSSSSSSSSRRVLDLSNFKSLKDFDINGFLDELEELVLYGTTTNEGLLSNLETLTLGGFSKLNSILWMAAQPDLLGSHFQSLYYIQIGRCDSLNDLKWVVYVENLKTLYVWECMGLETIIDLGHDGLEEAAGGRGVFRRLESLIMKNLPKLKSICKHALTFPSIETITIGGSPELKKLPLGSGSNVNNTLQMILGEEKWWNELQWEDETIKSKFLPYYKEDGYIDHVDVEADSAI